MNTVKAAQSSKNIPTVQELTEAVAQQLLELQDKVTDEMIDRAAKKAGIKPKTAKYEYLKGKVGFLHRGQVLYNSLMKQLDKNIKAAA